MPAHKNPVLCRLCCWTLAAALVFQTAPLSVLAQDGASVRGTAQAADGEPLPNVTVQIRSLRTSALVKSATTDKKGGFSFSDLEAGQCLVELLNANGDVVGTSASCEAIAPLLGSAQRFAVLGGSAVTNTGSSRITGDLGVSPGSVVTGFPPGVVSGTIHSGDDTAGAAQSSVTTAYSDLAGRPCTEDLTGKDLGGLTLTAGVYCLSASAQLTGTLTLDARGNRGAIFVFKIGSTLATASRSSVVMINAGSECNVYWQVGSSTTLGADTSFAGNILALTDITLTTGASVAGRTLARNGAVTLDTSTVGAACAVGAPPLVVVAAVPDSAFNYARLFAILGGLGGSLYLLTVLKDDASPSK